MEKPATDKHDPVGVDAAHLPSYSQDDVASAVMSYASPSFDLTVHQMSFDDEPSLKGKAFVVIEVREFSVIPIICKKSYQDESLYEGRFYIRSIDGYSTREVKAESEMRELIDVATEKGLTRLLRTISAAGGRIVPVTSESADAFSEEAKSFYA